MILNWIALIVFSLFALAGFGLTILGIGGTVLIVIGALFYDLITWSLAIPTPVLLWLAGLAFAGEALEWIITLIGLKAGMSKYALIGTVLGGIIGGFFLSIVPIFGTIVGLIVGALVGAFIGEYWHSRNSKKAWKAAQTALFGRALVSLCKVVIAITQIWLVLKEVI